MIEINTSKLHSAAERASRTRNECEGYGQELENKLINKLRNYCGERSSNISMASTHLNQKRSDVRAKQFDFQQYSADIASFRSMVVSEENRLERKIASLYGQFGKQHGIETEAGFWDQVSALIFGNLKPFLDNLFFGIQAGLITVCDHIKDFYRYHGGKELIEATLAIVTAILAVVGAAIAIVTGAGAIAILIASLVAVVTIVNASVKLVYAGKAIAATAAGENYMAVRYLNHAKNENFVSTLKREGFYEFADGFAVFEFVSNLLNLTQGIGSFLKNIKAAGGLGAALKGMIKKFDGFGKEGYTAKKFFDTALGALKATLSDTKASPKKLATFAKNASDAVYNLTRGDGKKIAETVLDFTIGSLLSQTITVNGKEKVFDMVGDATGLIGKALKSADSLAPVFNNQTITNFTYDAGKSNKPVSNFTIPFTDIKLDTFSSPGKFVTGVLGSDTVHSAVNTINGLFNPITTAPTIAGLMMGN